MFQFMIKNCLQTQFPMSQNRAKMAKEEELRIGGIRKPCLSPSASFLPSISLPHSFSLLLFLFSSLSILPFFLLFPFLKSYGQL